MTDYRHPQPKPDISRPTSIFHSPFSVLHRLPEPWRTRLFVRLGRWRWHRQGCPGDSHQWVWSRDQPFDRAACRQFLDQHFVPAFTHIAQAAPQPYGVAHLLALADIVSPEEQPLAQLTFDFPQAELSQAVSRIETFFLEQPPLALRPGSMIRFVLLNPAELFIPGWRVVRVAHRFVLTPEGTVNDQVLPAHRPVSGR